MQRIIIKIDKLGKTTIEAQGIEGSACSTHTRPFVLAMGKLIEEKKTTEFYQHPQTMENVQNQ